MKVTETVLKTLQVGESPTMCVYGNDFNRVSMACPKFCVNGLIAGNYLNLKGREMIVSKELIDRLLADYKKPEDLIGENGLLKQLTKQLVERALEAEMAEHFGHGKNEPAVNPWRETETARVRRHSRANLPSCLLDALYPIVCLDCIQVISRDAGAVKVKADCLSCGSPKLKEPSAGYKWSWN